MFVPAAIIAISGSNVKPDSLVLSKTGDPLLVYHPICDLMELSVVRFLSSVTTSSFGKYQSAGQAESLSA